MTNAQIILNESIDLMNAGIIGTTGNTLTYKDAAGAVHECQEPEQIHTFAAWKAAGYAVKKGEKAIASFMIWKHTTKKEKLTTKDGDEIEQDAGKMFMKKAHFFKFSQVEPLKA